MLFNNLPLRIGVVNRSGRILFQHFPREMSHRKGAGIHNINQLADKVQQSFSAWIQETFRTGQRMEKDYELEGAHRHVEFIPLPKNKFIS